MNLNGRSYKAGKVTFKVLEGEDYPAKKVSDRYAKILNIKAGCLVGVKFHSTVITNITYDKGVVRLNKIEVDGKVIDKAGKISEALGVDAPLIPYDLSEL